MKRLRLRGLTKEQQIEKKINWAQKKHKKYTKDGDRVGVLQMNYLMYDLQDELKTLKIQSEILG
jgi:hypothetical protein